MDSLISRPVYVILNASERSKESHCNVQGRFVRCKLYRVDERSDTLEGLPYCIFSWESSAIISADKTCTCAFSRMPRTHFLAPLS